MYIQAVVTDSLLSGEYARNHDVPAMKAFDAPGTKSFVLGQPLPFLPFLKRVSGMVPKLPSAYCALTSLVTILLLLPVFALYPASFCTLRIEMVPLTPSLTLILTPTVNPTPTPTLTLTLSLSLTLTLTLTLTLA